MDDAREALKGLAARASRARPLDPDDDVYSYENAIRAALDELDKLDKLRGGEARRIPGSHLVGVPCDADDWFLLIPVEPTGDA